MAGQIVKVVLAFTDVSSGAIDERVRNAHSIKALVRYLRAPRRRNRTPLDRTILVKADRQHLPSRHRLLRWNEKIAVSRPAGRSADTMNGYTDR